MATSALARASILCVRGISQKETFGLGAGGGGIDARLVAALMRRQSGFLPDED
jgi:hypothetical protein